MSDETEQTDQDHSYAEEPAVPEEQLEVETPSDEDVGVELLDSAVEEQGEDDDLDEIVESLAEDVPLPAQLADEAEADPQPESDAELAADESAEAEKLETSAVIVKPRSPVPRWPFWTLAGAWLALCGGAAYLLTRDPAMPSLRQDVYTFVVAAGLALTILGPIVAVVVWLFARSGAGEDSRTGMFATSLMRAALVTFFGVIAWTGVLILVDALRLGLIRF